MYCFILPKKKGIVIKMPIFNTPGGNQSAMQKASDYLNSPDGKVFLALVAGGGGDALKAAAGKAAMAGQPGQDKDALKILISSLMSSSEGMQLVSRVASLAGMLGK